MNRAIGRLLSHPLTRNSAFMHLWAGQTAAEFGFQVATLATSAIAISLLHATESEIGILTGLQTLAFLLIGLPAGAWVDRWRKRRVMIVSDLARVFALISIPIAYEWFTLTLTHLMIVAALLGLATVFFDVAYQSYVPAIASTRYIAAANGRLEASYQVGAAGGPGLGGWLLGVFAPPLAYVFTAATYVFSTVAIWRIRTPEPQPARPNASLLAQIREGLSFVRHERLLFPLFSCISFAAFTGSGELFSSTDPANASSGSKAHRNPSHNRQRDKDIHCSFDTHNRRKKACSDRSQGHHSPHRETEGRIHAPKHPLGTDFLPQTHLRHVVDGNEVRVNHSRTGNHPASDLGHVKRYRLQNKDRDSNDVSDHNATPDP